MEKILLVDDDSSCRQVLNGVLVNAGFEVLEAGDATGALTHFAKGGVDLVVLDLLMPGMEGRTLMKRIHEKESGLPVIFLTAHGTISSAVDTMREGAADFLPKPLTHVDVLVRAIRRAIECRRKGSKNPGPLGDGPGNDGNPDPIGNSGTALEGMDSPLASAERRTIQAALARFNGSRKMTSEFLGMTTRNLLYKLKRYGLGKDSSSRLRKASKTQDGATSPGGKANRGSLRIAPVSLK